jgi:hypothetical protein
MFFCLFLIDANQEFLTMLNFFPCNLYSQSINWSNVAQPSNFFVHDEIINFRYTAYKLLYYHLHGRAKPYQPRRDRIVLPNCVGMFIFFVTFGVIYYARYLSISGQVYLCDVSRHGLETCHHFFHLSLFAIINESICSRVVFCRLCDHYQVFLNIGISLLILDTEKTLFF